MGNSLLVYFFLLVGWLLGIHEIIRGKRSQIGLYKGNRNNCGGKEIGAEDLIFFLFGAGQ